jgi:hypothetical protein
VSEFTTKLEHAAENAAKHVSPPKGKIGPEPLHHSGVDIPASPHALPEGGLPVTGRTVVDYAALERTLERAGVRVAAGDAARLVALAEERLAGRAVEALSTAERDALDDALRQELVKLSPGAARRRQQLLTEAKAMFRADTGSSVVTTMASADGGTWVFFHTPSPTSPVIWGESFVPTKAGAPVPKKRPDLKKAGITGQPTWHDSAGNIVSTPPPLPAKPAAMPSGLDPQALDQAPALVLDELARARSAAVAAAERQAAPVKLYSLAPGTRRAGDRIRRIEKFAPSQPGGAWDELIVVEGVTGPEIFRMSRSEMDKVLPEIGKLTNAPEFQGLARMHVFGPIFGDETLAGLAFGPHEAANLLASGYTEAFARFDAKRSGRLNVKAGTPVKVSQYVKYRPVKGTRAGRYPFVVSVKYEYTLESGELVTAVIDISPAGEVKFFIDG